MRYVMARTTALGLISAALVLILSAFVSAQESPDIGWPRVFAKAGKELTVYQPQVDSWKDYTAIHFRCAVSVKGVLAEEKFGIAEIDATTVVDHATRTVAVKAGKRELRFGKVTDAEAAALRAAVEELAPSRNVTVIALDRVLAYLDASKHPLQQKAEINLDPPKIFYSAKPALLVVLIGKPRLKPVEADRTDLMFVLNTNWDILYDTSSKQYYLLNGDNWLCTADVMKGPWTPASQLPRSFASLPADENWVEARRHMPGKPVKAAPTVFVSSEPAELIVTAGVPEFDPISNTRLMQVTNTESILFLNTADGKYYFLVAGRWFRGGDLAGPWSGASKDLPDEFARIPDDDASAFVKACVPGTQEAQDALMLASIPKTITINPTEAKPIEVTYSGQPKFVPVQGATGVQYATNSPYTVFLVNGAYYCCFQGMWFTSAAATGPWAFCTSVPQPIYTIPPSHPTYNVTYVTVESSTPTTVVYSQTAGYSGEYVAATGVLMFGAGMLLGAAIADDDDHYYYYPPYPVHYSYGCGARYYYGYGGYHAAAYSCYGPYGGAGYATAYNPATGTYGRAAYAYGPYGAAGARAAYNPYTGGYAVAAGVTTPYGSAGRVAGYNPNTGTYGRAAGVSGQYGSAAAGRVYNPRTGAYAQGGVVSTDRGTAAAGSAYNPNTGGAAAGRAVSGESGSAGAIRTNQGTGAVAWDTENGQGAVVKTRSGDVYAGNGDTVYKKDSDGNWSSNSGSGWESVSKPQAEKSGTSSAQESRGSNSRDLEAQSKARERGNASAQTATQSRSGGFQGRGALSGSGSRTAPSRTSGGGGRGGRR